MVHTKSYNDAEKRLIAKLLEDADFMRKAMSDQQAADAIGCPKPTTREAMNRLRYEGYLEAPESDRSTGHLPKGLCRPHLELTDYIQQYGLWRLLEKTALKAIITDPDRSLKALDLAPILSRQQEAEQTGNIIDLVSADIEFHAMIFKKAGLPEFANTVEKLMLRTRFAVSENETQEQRRAIKESNRRLSQMIMHGTYADAERIIDDRIKISFTHALQSYLCGDPTENEKTMDQYWKMATNLIGQNEVSQSRQA